MIALATTFMDGLTIQVEVLEAPRASTGLVKCQFHERRVIRHKDLLTPVNQEAAVLLGKEAQPEAPYRYCTD